MEDKIKEIRYRDRVYRFNNGEVEYKGDNEKYWTRIEVVINKESQDYKAGYKEALTSYKKKLLKEVGKLTTISQVVDRSTDHKINLSREKFVLLDQVKSIINNIKPKGIIQSRFNPCFLRGGNENKIGRVSTDFSTLAGNRD